MAIAQLYARDWETHEGVEDAILHRRDANGVVLVSYPVKLLVNGLNRPDYQMAGQGHGDSPNEPDGYLWLLPPNQDDAADPVVPRVDDAIERTEYGTELVITDVFTPRIGPYRITLTEGRRNE